MSIIIMAMMDNYYALGSPVPFCPLSWRWALSSQMASPTAIVKGEYREKMNVTYSLLLVVIQAS